MSQSMDNLQKLIEMVQKNPELPVHLLLGDEFVGDESGRRWACGFGTPRIIEAAIYHGELYIDREEFEEDYYTYSDDAICAKSDYNPRVNKRAVNDGWCTMKRFVENEKHKAELYKHLDNVADSMFKQAIIVEIHDLEQVEDVSE